jgi:3-hydroxyisobutyrate dehydrogenase-like beta-hydroxyacid dehydrogenase
MASAKAIGVLYPGEMGASLAALLRRRGHRVVTTLAGRGERTARLCREAGMTVLPSLADVVRAADVVISVVPPAAAEDVAAAYCEHASLAPSDALYVDLNAIRPELAEALAGRLAARGRGFVDAAVNGLAKNLTTTATLYLSGPRAAEVASLVGEDMRVKLLGDQPGRASAMKMLLSGLSKGVCALFVETALVAERQGMLAEMTEAYAQIYPGVTAVVERMLPTYPQHAGRRAAEMAELEQTALASGLEPCVLAAVARVHEMLAGADLGQPAKPGGGWTLTSIIERLATEGLLAAEPAGAAERSPKHAIYPTDNKPA